MGPWAKLVLWQYRALYLSFPRGGGDFGGYVSLQSSQLEDIRLVFFSINEGIRICYKTLIGCRVSDRGGGGVHSVCRSSVGSLEV